MKKIQWLFMIILGLSVTSCQKEVNGDTGIDNTGTGTGTGGGTGAPGTFEVKINGQLTTFNVLAATLLRSNPDNVKRLDIAGVSKDQSKQLIITIGDTPASGNDVHLKNYVIDLFNEDDPNTPQDESLGNDDGFITYSTSLGNNSWLTDVFAENGNMQVTACDAAAKKVSGTFAVKDSSLNDGSVINFTEGKFTNISYQVLN